MAMRAGLPGYLGRGLRLFSTTSVSPTRKGIEDLAASVPLQGGAVLVRADLNVPLSIEDGKTITDDTRVRAVLPTVRFLSSQGAKVILCSHFGRPKGAVVDSMRLTPVAACLSGLLGKPVTKLDDCVGDAVRAEAAQLKGGDVMLLENVRFHKGETKNDPAFAEQLASVADIYVNDAFGTAHRAHASTEGVTHFMQHSVAGFLLQKELKYLQGAIDKPARPFAAMIGGAKVSTKIPVLESLMGQCDTILLGGGMIFTFYRAKGLSTGTSVVEEEYIDLAKTLMDKAQAQGVKLLLPEDVVVADAFAADASAKEVPASGIPDGWMGLDIGAGSVDTYKKELSTCKTVVWNGPMGVFEFDKFAAGTNALAVAVAEMTAAGATTIVGGGDCVAAVEKAGVSSQISHISTGGGASLELLEGKELPGVAALDSL